MGITYSGTGPRRVYTVQDLHQLRTSGKWSKYPDAVFALPFESSITEDLGLGNHAWIVNGSAALSTEHIYNSSYSAYFGGANYLNLASFSELAGYSGDLTLSVFFRLDGTPTGTTYNSSYYILGGGPLNSDPGFDFAIGNTAIWFSHYAYPTRILSGTWTPDLIWHHVAVVRQSNNWTMYLDGASVATATDATAIPASITNMAIGRCEPTGGVSAGYFKGWMKELLVVKKAMFTAPFTVNGLFM